MAKQKKRVASRKTKSKKKKLAKKSAKRAIGRKSRRLPKKMGPKASQKKAPSRGRPKTTKMVPVVEGEIIDVVDEPLPGVVRVTEIEATRVTIPDANDDGET